MDDKYILDEAGNPKIEYDIRAWGKWLQESGNKIIKQEDVIVGDKKYWVSTVFLGLNYTWGDGEPTLFETMVFDRTEDPKSWGDVDMERYSTKEDALKGHEKMVNSLKERK